MTEFDADDELTELYDADIPRVDLVDKAANGIARFLIAKREDGAGLMDPDDIRALIGKSEPEPEREEQVTMTGSPGAIAKMIHAAAERSKAQAVPVHVEVQGSAVAQRDLERHIREAVRQTNTDTAMSQALADAAGVAKAELSTKKINDLPDSAFAYVEPGGKKDESGKTTPRSLRHFPINDEAHVRNALSRAPQSPFGDKAMPRIRSAAKKFGIEVSKAMAMELDETADGMDPTVALAAPEDEAAGDPMDPGSPAWEAIDAATARKWTSIAVRLRNAVSTLAERELLEAATGDGDDAESAWDLQDAECALDYVIDVLAGFAVEEQAEADLCTEAMAAVGKALGDFDTAPLDTIEALAPIAKAGRVLSAANEAAIRGAAEALQKVLASLPQAPVTEDSGQPVAKEETVTALAAETVEPEGPAHMGTPKDDPAPEARTDSLVKADGEGKPAQVAVYDKKGNLVGIVDPGDITPIAGAEAEDDGPADDPDGDGEPAAAPATDATDMTPAPAAEVGTPADAVPDDDSVTKTESTNTNDKNDTDSDAVLKGIAADVVNERLADYSATQEQVIAKQAEALTQMAELVETLKGRVQALEEQEAPSKVFTNGAVPPDSMLRGQAYGVPQASAARAHDLKKALYGGSDAAAQKRAFDEMQAAAIAGLEQIHQQQR